jgi:hypothetical protein
MYCGKCGADRAEGDIFCPMCGAAYPVPDETPAAPEEATPAEAPDDRPYEGGMTLQSGNGPWMATVPCVDGGTTTRPAKPGEVP